MTTTLNIHQLGYEEKILHTGQLVGKTPLYEIKGAYHKPGVRIFAKLEWQQIGGSVKARAAFNIIKNAIRDGHIGQGKHILDATSGNTGIAYASIGAALGIPVTLCLPENASEERKRILLALGVNLMLTPKADGTDGSQVKAKELLREQPDLYYHANQYANDSNWQAHFNSTGHEIWNQTNGKITHFVVGLGTTGTLTGTGRRLKLYNPDIELVALQPDNAMHGLQGWKHMETAAFVPKIYDASLPDRILEIDATTAYPMVKRVAETEGLLIGPTAAANLCGAIKVAEEIDKGIIVTTFADTADKYSEAMKVIFA
ncbi:MAG TPA: cysteine synthase family protein [Bacteroidetes bacterium]|nr:cysteine synthase family protein [Bacteroidota bacterium]